MAARRKRRWLDRWVTPGAQKMLVGMAVVGLFMLSCAGLAWLWDIPSPAYTELDRYDITPAGQRVLMFEFDAARDRVLIVTQAAPPADNQRVVRVEVYIWDVTTRQLASIGQFDGVALREHSWERHDEATRASDGGFFLFTRTLLRIGGDGQVTSYPNRTPSLTPEDVQRLANTYDASGEPVYRIDRGAAEPSQAASRHYLFAIDGQPFFLHNLTEDPLAVTTGQAPRERAVLNNPVVHLNVPMNPDFVRESPLFDAWNHESYESEAERMIVTTRRDCFMVPLCPHYPKIIVKVERRRYAFDSHHYPFVPQSGYMTARDGTLFWLRDGHLYALR
jgi:hypothetical protein